MNEPNLSPEFLQDLFRKMAQAKEQQMFPTPQFHSFRLGEAIGRSIWKRIFTRKKTEHLHEFIFHAMFWVFGDKWYKEEKEKPFEQQHIVVRWEQARYDFLGKVQELGLKPNQMVMPTGEVRELLSLAADMYYLQLVDELPKNLVKRLKNPDGFQGARYEIAVAASLVRGGFAIQWTNSHNTNKKIHEFDAFQSYTNETIAIEAKSRRRDGTLHEKGVMPNFDEIKLDIFSLLNKAMKQNPNDKPFGIFIDINLPRPKNLQNSDETWKTIYFEKLKNEGASIFGENPPTFLAITNSAWHYDKDNLTSGGEFFLTIPTSQNVKFPLKNEVTFQSITRALTKFSQIPEDDLSW